MRYSQSEKMEIIRLVEQSTLGVKRTLAEFGLSRSTFYRWYKAYQEEGFEGLSDSSPERRRHWNRIPDAEREKVVEMALAKPELSPRELEVLEGLAQGLPYKLIADRLDISMGTIRTHIEHIYRKLHVHNRTDAVVKYLQGGS